MQLGIHLICMNQVFLTLFCMTNSMLQYLGNVIYIQSHLFKISASFSKLYLFAYEVVVKTYQVVVKPPESGKATRWWSSYQVVVRLSGDGQATRWQSSYQVMVKLPHDGQATRQQSNYQVMVKCAASCRRSMKNLNNQQPWIRRNHNHLHYQSYHLKKQKHGHIHLYVYDYSIWYT